MLVLIVLAASLGLLITADPPGPGAEASVFLYTRSDPLKIGRPFPIVVEVENRSGDTLALIDRPVGIERRIDSQIGRNQAPDRKSEVKAEATDRLRFRVVVTVPSGASRRHIAPQPPGPVTPVEFTLGPGKSRLMRVDIPAEAFEHGACHMEVVLLKGSVVVDRSAPTAVEVTQ